MSACIKGLKKSPKKKKKDNYGFGSTENKLLRPSKLIIKRKVKHRPDAFVLSPISLCPLNLAKIHEDWRFSQRKMANPLSLSVLPFLVCLSQNGKKKASKSFFFLV